jgi:hypothetical protein
LGDDWFQRQWRLVQQHANAYQRAAWAKALSYLSGSASCSGQLSGGSDNNNGILKFAIKERYIWLFNCRPIEVFWKYTGFLFLQVVIIFY